MNVATFIAKRIAFSKGKSFSRFIIRLSTSATALSVAAMIITVCVVTGFQNAISQKVFSFWGHIRVQQYSPQKSAVAEESAVEQDPSILKIIKQSPQVKHVQPFATKSAVLEKKSSIEGVLIKGVDSSFDFGNLQQFLVSGSWIHFHSNQLYSRDIVISQDIAKELDTKVNDSLMVYFIQSNQGKTEGRKMRISGIFKTGIEEYDKLFAIADLGLIQKVNNWEHNEIGGYEVFLNNYKSMDSVSNTFYDELPGAWVSRTVKEIYPSIFDWLNIQDVNRNVIFAVMSIVAIINLITCLLILVLERTKTTGLLKSVGATDTLIQNIFLYYSSIIAIRGILIGLFIGAGFCLLQQATGFIKLDETSYYISAVPVTMQWFQIATICVVTFIVCFLALIIPTLFVRSIKPLKAITFK